MQAGQGMDGWHADRRAGGLKRQGTPLMAGKFKCSVALDPDPGGGGMM